MTYARGAALVLTAGLMWSTIGLLIRLLQAADVWQVLFWRSVALVPVLALWLAFTSGGRPLAAIRAAGLAGLIGAAGLVAAFAGGIAAIQSTTIANAVFLFAATPLIAAVIGRVVLGERVARATWAAMAVAGIGMAVMVREGLSLGAGWGNLAAILSSTGFAAFTVCLRWGRVGDMLPAVVLGGVLSALVAATVVGLSGGTLAVPPGDLAITLVMGGGVLGVAMVLFTAGSRVLPAVDLALFSMVEVLLAPVWVFLVLGESASPATFAGGAIVLAALAFNAVAATRGRVAA